MKKINLLLALLLTLSLSLTAQKTKKYKFKNTKAAEKAFNEGKYTQALVLFDKAYKGAKSAKEKGFITFQLGLCNQLNGNNKEARKQYERAIRLRYEKTNPELYTRLAQMQMQEGKYTKAKRNFEQALKKNPEDEIARKGIKACAKANKIIKKPTKHKVEVVKELNTKHYDWSISKYDKKGEQFIFSSTRKSSFGNKDDEVKGEPFTDLYVTTIDRNGNFGEPIPLDESINTKQHEASAVLYNKGKNMLFTRCGAEKNKVLGCKIYRTTKKGKSWKTPELITLSDSIGYSEGHPATDKKGTFIVFAAKMPGGYGGSDLYITEYNKRNKTWSKPKNLGSQINTAGDEKFPTIGDDGSLYFSSDALPGIGGLDIFKAKKSASKNIWSSPQNLGAPINSSKDDHGITYTSPSSGYFSSARLSKNDQDLKLDIYKFSLPECALAIQGRVRDQDTKEILPGSSVTLTGSDGSTATIRTDSKGNFEFGKRGTGRYVKKGVNYNMVFEGKHAKNIYAVKKTKKSTMDKELCNEIFYEDIELICLNCKPIIMPEVQYIFGTDKFVVNDKINSKDSLLFLYEIMIDNPTLKVQLEAHTDCRGSDAANEALAQKRAQACVDYLISKGIDRSRLVAKGFGEAVPRIIQENGKDLTLECDMIMALQKTDKAKFEKYHQLNRRTTFSIIPDPKDKK